MSILIFLCVLIESLSGQLTTDQYLTHYWPITCSTMLDQIGTAHMTQGAFTNFTTDRFGNIKSALALNGGYTQIPSGIYFDSPEFTISVWVYPQNLGAYSRVIDVGNGCTPPSNNGLDMIVLQLSKGAYPNPPALTFCPNITWTHTPSSTNLVLSQWQFLVGTFNGTNTFIYLNGQLKATAKFNYILPIRSRSSCYIGKSGCASDGNSKSFIDELRIYNKSLTQTEIIQLMNQNQTTSCLTTSTSTQNSISTSMLVSSTTARSSTITNPTTTSATSVTTPVTTTIATSVTTSFSTSTASSTAMSSSITSLNTRTTTKTTIVTTANTGSSTPATSVTTPVTTTIATTVTTTFSTSTTKSTAMSSSITSLDTKTTSVRTTTETTSPNNSKTSEGTSFMTNSSKSDTSATTSNASPFTTSVSPPDSTISFPSSTPLALSTPRSISLLNNILDVQTTTAKTSYSGTQSFINCGEKISAAGRARIEYLRDLELANIQTRRVEALRKLDVDYYYWDKVAKNIGYIGISSLIFLFTSIFFNDLVKVFVHYFNKLKNYCRRKKNKKRKEKENLQKELKEKEEEDNFRIQMENSNQLEMDLEKVYFKLLKANAKNRTK